jgi:hypothetical protein
MVTLYIATHNKTGLKYFGKTKKYLTEEELQLKYHGSGSMWKKHLKEFGDDVTMKVVGTYDLEEASSIALKFSDENDIVNSDKWANLIPEDCFTGGGGVNTGLTYEEYYGEERAKLIKKKISRIKSSEERQKISKALTGREGNNKGKTFSDDTKIKMSVAASKRERQPFSEEAKEKMSESAKKRKPTMTGKKQKIVTCPFCGKKGGINGMVQWHFDKCKMKDSDEL